MLALLLLLALIATPAAAFADGPSGVSVREEEEVDPGLVGMDARRLSVVDRLIEEAIRKQVTPGAAIAIGRHGRLVRLRGYGRIDYRADAPRVTESTIYDIASLTKAVGTTSAAMMLVQDGRLDLDRPLVEYFPEWQGVEDRRWMTARHLLTHTSGLPAGGPLSGVVRREDVVAFMAEVKLRARPGARYQYSDYGLILLGSLIERITGERLDSFLQRELFQPLGLQETGFNPKRWTGDESSPFHLASSATAPLTARIAPTERTPRRGVIRGEVHDPLAYRLDGVAGNAGIFSSARDLAVFARLLLHGGALGDTRIFADSILQEFTRRRSPLARHALGWELAREDGPSGSLFPSTAFGHTGFTGTSLFVDPEHDLFVVLLTNRVYPNASEHRHIALRKAVHDAVMKAIADQALGE